MRAKIIAPVLVYLLITMAGFSFHAWRHKRIETMYEEARHNNLPLVISHHGERLYLNWRIHTMSGETVGLSPDNDWPFPGFTANYGSTVFYVDLILTRPIAYYIEFSIPEDDPRIVYDHVYFQEFDIPSMSGSTVINLPWRIYGDGKQVSIINDLTDETIPLPFESKAPWEEPIQDFDFDRFNTWFSSDAGMLFIRDAQGVWRYDIANDEWLKLCDATTTFLQYTVSQDGAIAAAISIARNQNYQVTSINTEFIDTHSGEIIRSIPDVNCISMGNRWAACLNYPLNVDQMGTTTDPLVFTIYDLGNEQESYQITLNDRINPIFPIGAFQLLLIEPE